MNKRRLLQESFRLLKPKGELLLCDVMLKRKPNIADHADYLLRLKAGYPSGYFSMKRAFGRGKTEPFALYFRELMRAGYSRITVVDISKQVIPTLRCWLSNVESYGPQIAESFTEQQLQDFVRATRLLDDLYKDDIQGYGMIRATKPAS
jgi:ubiquinone/menaquinone biosynthesis C-methylase UbiE